MRTRRRKILFSISKAKELHNVEWEREKMFRIHRHHKGFTASRNIKKISFFRDNLLVCVWLLRRRSFFFPFLIWLQKSSFRKIYTASTSWRMWKNTLFSNFSYVRFRDNRKMKLNLSGGQRRRRRSLNLNKRKGDVHCIILHTWGLFVFAHSLCNHWN